MAHTSETGRQEATGPEGVPASLPWYIRQLTIQSPLGFNAGDTNLYRYVGNNPTNRVDPSGLYEEDIHYSMTFYLAIAAGIPEGDAEEIAWAANATDYHLEIEPIQKRYWKGLDFRTPAAISVRRKYHFRCAPGDKVTAGSDAAASIVNDAIKAKRNDPFLMGIGLHAFEDSWSHAGFGAEDLHSFGKDNPDYPYNAPGKAMEMAEAVYNKLVEYRKKYFPDCKPLKSFDDIKKTLERLMAFEGKEKERAKKWNQQIKDDFNLDAEYSPGRLKEPRMADALWRSAQTIQEPKK